MKRLLPWLMLLVASSALAQPLAGIGISLKKDGADFLVQAVLPDSPASASGAIHPGDRILAVGQENQPGIELRGRSIQEAVGMIRGPKGTALRVTIVPAEGEDSDARIVSLVRGELKLPAAAMPVRAFPDEFWMVRLGLTLLHPW